MTPAPSIDESIRDFYAEKINFAEIQYQIRELERRGQSAAEIVLPVPTMTLLGLPVRFSDAVDAPWVVKRTQLPMDEV